MKVKPLAVLGLFFIVSFAAWSYVPEEPVEKGAEVAAPTWPELPKCTGRDRGDDRMARITTGSAKGLTLSPQENPIESSFLELTCLLASN